MKRMTLTAMRHMFRLFMIVTCMNFVGEVKMAPRVCAPISPGTEWSGGIAREEQLYDTRKIRLETKILAQEDVPADNELRVVKLKLKLTYFNHGTESVLIYKGHSFISHVWISANKEKALAKEFEASVSQTVLFAGDKKIHDLTKQEFVTLSIGGLYETEETVTILVRHNGDNRIGGSIAKGEHVLQVYLETWPWTKEETDRFREKFPECEKLLETPITSEPMRIIV